MNENRRPAGLILSAGYSSRMEEFKPLMKIGSKNLLEILISSMRIAGIEDIFVVVGYKAEIITDFLKPFGVRTVLNENFDKGMFTSVQRGVQAAHENRSDCILMTPVDIPLIPPYIFKAVLNRYYRSQGSFVVPCFGGRKGHPLCIPAEMTGEILNSSGENGMKSITGAHSDNMVLFETGCEGIIHDMDTQEAYRNILEYYSKNKYPDEEKCYRILSRMETPPQVVKHCIAVADTAVAIAEELNKKGGNFSVPLVKAASMLHDVLRVRKNHWEEGARLVMDYGYPEVAEIVMDHMNYVHSLPVESITEKDIVCLSDKLRQEEELVTLEERLSPALDRFKDDSEAVKAIRHKIDAAEGVRGYIENVLGENLYEMLKKHDSGKTGSGTGKRASRRLILIRHGETLKHREPIFLGRTDVPLSDEGREQCAFVGIKMRNFGLNTDVIYCSDLKRTRESAEIISRELGGGFNIVDVPEFREISLGRWDGRYISDVKREYPEEYRQRGEDPINFRIDEAAENYYDVQRRASAKLRELINATHGDIVIVSHSGVNRVLKCMVLGKELDEITKMKFGRGTYEIFDI